MLIKEISGRKLTEFVLLRIVTVNKQKVEVFVMTEQQFKDFLA